MKLSVLVSSWFFSRIRVSFRHTGTEGSQATRRSMSLRCRPPRQCILVTCPFYTTEDQVYELFSRAGEIKKIIMGLDKNTKTPCRFCFISYYSREDAEDAVKYISGTILDDRPIHVDFDWGFEDGRQWGRGRSDGQVTAEEGHHSKDGLLYMEFSQSLFEDLFLKGRPRTPRATEFDPPEKHDVLLRPSKRKEG